MPVWMGDGVETLVPDDVDEAVEVCEAVEPGVADEVEADEAVLLLGITEVSVTMTAVVSVYVHVNVTVPLSLGHDMGV